MTPSTIQAIEDLYQIGFAGQDVALAELIPVVEMAWADGELQANERAMLEAYAETLTTELNQRAGRAVFSIGHTLELLAQLTQDRLLPHDRQRALRALQILLEADPEGPKVRARMLQWAEAVAAVDGRPVWDARELFWLESMRQSLSPQ